VVLSFCTGFFVSVAFAFFVFGPICYDQSEKNGGPFEPGDLVQIIWGPHQDRIGRVYSDWQQGALRVELGDEAREKYNDIFAPYQLLRVDDGSGN